MTDLMRFVFLCFCLQGPKGGHVKFDGGSCGCLFCVTSARDKFFWLLLFFVFLTAPLSLFLKHIEVFMCHVLYDFVS